VIDPLVCPACGARDTEPRLAPHGPDALVCSGCGRARPFARLPLLCLTGPSGTGKSTAAGLVAPLVADRVVTLEQDVLWRPELADRPGGVRAFRATWLRLAAMIGQSGRPVLLCGTVVPAEIEPLPERLLFRDIHYLALVTDIDVMADRLRARPAWRGWDEGRVAEMVAFARELRATARAMQPPGELLDTTGRSPEQVAEDVARWVLERA
jgi:broad-specificity NMP kinase